MFASSLYRRITLFFLILGNFLCIDNSVEAKITIKGNKAQKREIQEAIDLLKQQSETAKKLFEQLEARKENVIIRFDNEAKFTARAFLKGYKKAKKHEVVINKTRLGKLTQIDNKEGEGKALEQLDLKYVIAHEALGHILFFLERGGVIGDIEVAEHIAVRIVNKIRVEADSVKRTKYTQSMGRGKNKMMTVPFADGSKVNVTDALKMGDKKTNGLDLFDVIQEGTLNIQANVDNSSPDTINLSLNPSTSLPTLDIFIPDDIENEQQIVDVLDFKATLTDVTENTEDFNLIVTDFELLFSSFNLDANSTGINRLELVNPWHIPVGNWDYSNLSTNFSFDFSGEFLLTNDLVSDDIAFEELSGSMIANGHNWTGSANLEGVKFTRTPISVPESSSLLGLLSIGFLGVIQKWGIGDNKNRKN